MATILWFDGLRVVIYPNDHEPEHVHVLGADKEAIFDLNCAGGMPSLRENYRFGRPEVKRILLELRENLELLCDAWSAIHG
jgi:hypothetical protein